MKKEDLYSVLAFYIFVPIADPHAEVELHKLFFSSRDASCRIYISEEGINGQLCLANAHAQEYMDWMHSRTLFQDIYFKVHSYHEHVFPRVTVKYRKQLVALDKQVDMNKTGQHISPAEWKRRMEEEKGKHLLLDVRNHYEWLVGRFEGAVSPNCETFREFDEYTNKLVQEVDPKNTPVMMCCTGGIRCELYSALLKEKGFDEVYQLDGGIINYGLQEGSKHWLGKLFVFDDRLTVPISDEECPVVGSCKFCETPIESYYNCSSMDCNILFLSCHECLEKHIGCCSDECTKSTRLRPFASQNPHKPFRRWQEYFEEKPKH